MLLAVMLAGVLFLVALRPVVRFYVPLLQDSCEPWGRPISAGALVCLFRVMSLLQPFSSSLLSALPFVESLVILTCDGSAMVMVPCGMIVCLCGCSWSVLIFDISSLLCVVVLVRS